MRKTLIVIASSLVVAFLLIQLVPYRVHNPAARDEPNWDSRRTRTLAVVACYECHSNEVKTPWYGKVAPVSWLVTHHVDDGRAALNFSEWSNTRGRRSDDLLDVIREGSMPPSYFTWFGLHSDAKLTPAERDELIQGLRATLQR